MSRPKGSEGVSDFRRVAHSMSRKYLRLLSLIWNVQLVQCKADYLVQATLDPVVYLGFREGGCMLNTPRAKRARKILRLRPLLLTAPANVNAATPISWCAILRIALSLH